MEEEDEKFIVSDLLHLVWKTKAFQIYKAESLEKNEYSPTAVVGRSCWRLLTVIIKSIAKAYSLKSNHTHWYCFPLLNDISCKEL